MEKVELIVIGDIFGRKEGELITVSKEFAAELVERKMCKYKEPENKEVAKEEKTKKK